MAGLLEKYWISGLEPLITILLCQPPDRGLIDLQVLLKTVGRQQELNPGLLVHESALLSTRPTRWNKGEWVHFFQALAELKL